MRRVVAGLVINRMTPRLDDVAGSSFRANLVARATEARKRGAGHVI